MGFVSNFVLFHQYKNFENWSRFHKVTERLKVGTFLRYDVDKIKEYSTV